MVINTPKYPSISICYDSGILGTIYGTNGYKHSTFSQCIRMKTMLFQVPLSHRVDIFSRYTFVFDVDGGTGAPYLISKRLPLRHTVLNRLQYLGFLVCV